jgi:hypothetical protein
MGDGFVGHTYDEPPVLALDVEQKMIELVAKGWEPRSSERALPDDGATLTVEANPSGVTPWKLGVTSDTVVRLKDREGKSLATIWANAGGAELQVEYAEVRLGVRRQGVYRRLLERLSAQYRIVADQPHNNAAKQAYLALGAREMRDGRLVVERRRPEQAVGATRTDARTDAQQSQGEQDDADGDAQKALAFADFVGPGGDCPSDVFEVSDDDARELLDCLQGAEIGQALWQSGRYTIGAPQYSESSSVLLLHDGQVVGFYEGSCLWIAEDHRGVGLSMPLILAAALDRSDDGPCVLPDGVDMHGYSVAGYAAHERAFDRLWAANSDLRAALGHCRAGSEMTPTADEPGTAQRTGATASANASVVPGKPESSPSFDL